MHGSQSVCLFLIPLVCLSVTSMLTGRYHEGLRQRTSSWPKTLQNTVKFECVFELTRHGILLMPEKASAAPILEALEDIQIDPSSRRAC